MILDFSFLWMNNFYLAKFEMARDITENESSDDVQTKSVQATLYIEKIILLSNKKIGQDEISYMQVCIRHIFLLLFLSIGFSWGMWDAKFFYRLISTDFQRTARSTKNLPNTFFQLLIMAQKLHLFFQERMHSFLLNSDWMHSKILSNMRQNLRF